MKGEETVEVESAERLFIVQFEKLLRKARPKNDELEIILRNAITVAKMDLTILYNKRGQGLFHILAQQCRSGLNEATQLLINLALELDIKTAQKSMNTAKSE